MSKRNLSFLLVSTALAISLLACNLGAAPQGISATLPPALATDGAPVTVVESPTQAQQGQPITPAGACSNPYLPIVAGATWNYSLTGPIPDTFTRSILSVEAGGFTDQDVFASGVTRQGKWNCDNGSLVALNPSGGSSASINTEGVTVDFQTTAISGVTLPASLGIGANWAQSVTLEGTQTIAGTAYPASNQMTSACTATAIESVTVAAGTFEALRVECQITMIISVTMAGNPIQSTLAFNTINWYTLSVGLIKSASTGGGMDSTTELISYSIP